MKLFLIEQDQNDEYDTYDSAVVAAPDEETARWMDPGTGRPVENWGHKWCSGPEYVNVIYLGEAVFGVARGVVCASFNAS
jgi:hypothetical protein